MMKLQRVFWSWYAGYYATAIGILSSYQGMLTAVEEELPRGAGLHFVDLGCGPGFLMERLIEEHGDWHFLGMDAAGDMLRRASGKVIDPSLDVNLVEVDVVEAVKDWRFGPQDVVVCTDVLYLIKDAQTFLRGVYQLLAPGGCFILVDVTHPDQWAIWRRHVHELLALPPDQRPREVLRSLRLVPAVIVNSVLAIAGQANNLMDRVGLKRREQAVYFRSKKEIACLLTDAGFRLAGNRQVYAGNCTLIVARKPE